MSRVIPILPGLVLIEPPYDPGSGWERPNIYLLGHDPITFLDSGYDRPGNAEAMLAAAGGARVEKVLLTHGHIDHAGGAWPVRERTGCEVWAHEAEAAVLARRFPGQGIDRWLDSGDEVEAGDFTLRAIHTPGHAIGHVVFWAESEGLLFTGDLVTGQGSTLVAPPEGNMRAYLKSLREVQRLPARILLPGHGPVVREPGRRIAELIEHRELREICIARCLLSGPRNLKDLVRDMYLGLIHPGLEMAAAGTAWAHLEKMIEEGSVLSEPTSEANPFARIFRLSEAARPDVEKLSPRSTT